MEKKTTKGRRRDRHLARVVERVMIAKLRTGKERKKRTKRRRVYLTLGGGKKLGTRQCCKWAKAARGHRMGKEAKRKKGTREK